MESSAKNRGFGFKLDNKQVRKIAFEKGCIASQVFVELVELSRDASSTVLDNRFVSSVQKVINHCSSQSSLSELVRIFVCLIIPTGSTSSTTACSQLARLQQLYPHRRIIQLTEC